MSVTFVDVGERLKRLRWDGDVPEPHQDADERLFACLPRDHPLLSDDAKAERAYVFIAPDLSVTREMGGVARAEDALLRIGQSGFLGVRDGFGVIFLRVGYAHGLRLVSGGSESFASCVEHVPYPDNRAHSEIRVYKDGVGRDWREVPPASPKGVRRELRRIIAARIHDQVVAGESAVACPAGFTRFTNVPPTPEGEA